MEKFIKILVAIIFFVAIQLTLNKAQATDIPDHISDLQFYFLIDADSGEVLLSKNADKPIPPSSMTKLMTAYVVFDQIKKGAINLDNKCLIGKDAWRKSGSSMFLNYGDVVTIEKLLKGLLASSGNDAAIALAESVGGGFDKFIDLMNLRALELGLSNSHFKNPHGLHEKGHYMSLRDLTTLVTKIYQNFPEYSKYLGIKKFTYQKITQRNRNPLIKNKYDGVIGGKTGHTTKGGYGVIGVVKRDHRRLIGVINKVKSSKKRASAIEELFDYGFDRYKKVVLFNKGQTVADLQVWLGRNSQVKVAVNSDISLNIPRDESINSINVWVKYLGPIHAPISKNTKVADLIVEVDGDKVLKYPLFTKENVNKAGYFKRINQILRYKLSHFYN